LGHTITERATCSLFVWLVADGWWWFVLREKYCWLIAGGWFVLREKYCWLVADKPSDMECTRLHIHELPPHPIDMAPRQSLGVLDFHSDHLIHAAAVISVMSKNFQPQKWFLMLLIRTHCQ
jgi:hypothetical protein